MANYWPDVWTDLRTAIATAWPEIGSKFRSLQIEKVDWVNQIQRGDIVPPYVVVHVPPAQADGDFGLANVTYRMRVGLYYIAQDAEEVLETIEERLKTMQDYLLDAARAYGAIQVLDEDLQVEVTEASAINQALLDNATPMSAGALLFSCLVGETVV